MKVNLKIIKWKDMVYLDGRIKNMKVNGKIVKWMVKENLDGMMEEDM